nr:splicing factor [Tanacetum cinerariifolium]
MDDLKYNNIEAYEYLVARNLNSWCRDFFNLNVKCAAFENGISESYHKAMLLQRSKPIITMLEDIRIYIMQSKRWGKGSRGGGRGQMGAKSGGRGQIGAGSGGRGPIGVESGGIGPMGAESGGKGQMGVESGGRGGRSGGKASMGGARGRRGGARGRRGGGRGGRIGGEIGSTSGLKLMDEDDIRQSMEDEYMQGLLDKQEDLTQ